jgi:hypothetical protein
MNAAPNEWTAENSKQSITRDVDNMFLSRLLTAQSGVFSNRRALHRLPGPAELFPRWPGSNDGDMVHRPSLVRSTRLSPPRHGNVLVCRCRWAASRMTVGASHVAASTFGLAPGRVHGAKSRYFS